MKGRPRSYFTLTFSTFFCMLYTNMHVTLLCNACWECWSTDQDQVLMFSKWLTQILQQITIYALIYALSQIFSIWTSLDRVSFSFACPYMILSSTSVIFSWCASIWHHTLFVAVLIGDMVAILWRIQWRFNTSVESPTFNVRGTTCRKVLPLSNRPIPIFYKYGGGVQYFPIILTIFAVQICLLVH